MLDQRGEDEGTDPDQHKQQLASHSLGGTTSLGQQSWGRSGIDHDQTQTAQRKIGQNQAEIGAERSLALQQRYRLGTTCGEHHQSASSPSETAVTG